jgi:hypothetical protein
VGMKSRGIYETPGGTLLYAAHSELEQLVLDRRTLALKDASRPATPTWSTRAAGGRWSARRWTRWSTHPGARHRRGAPQALQGHAARRRPHLAHSLYDERFVTFGEDDVYDQADAAGFIRLYGLPMRVAALKAREMERRPRRGLGSRGRRRGPDDVECSVAAGSAAGPPTRGPLTGERPPNPSMPKPCPAPPLGRPLRRRARPRDGPAEPLASRGPPAVAGGRRGEPRVGGALAPPACSRGGGRGAPAGLDAVAARLEGWTRRSGPTRRRGHPLAGGAAAARGGGRGGGQAAHRPLAQRPGRHRHPALGARGAARLDASLRDLQRALLEQAERTSTR